jgi:hypothetical protein
MQYYRAALRAAQLIGPAHKHTQRHTHIGNATTALHLVLHPGECVVVGSHIRNDGLLVRTALVHI